jgi:hypothetical protein
MSRIPVLHPSGDPCRAKNWLSWQFVIAKLAALVPKPRVNLIWFVRIFPDTYPLRGPAEAVQNRS